MELSPKKPATQGLPVHEFEPLTDENVPETHATQADAENAVMPLEPDVPAAQGVSKHEAAPTTSE